MLRRTKSFESDFEELFIENQIYKLLQKSRRFVYLLIDVLVSTCHVETLIIC